MRVTLLDVAKSAGVGRTAASVILNDPENAGRFNDQTIERVRRIAAEMGYFPNLRARSLRKKQSEIIGFAFGGNISRSLLSQNYFSSLAGGMQQALFAHGFNLLLVTGHGSEQPAEIGLKYLKSGRIDGLVCLGSHEHHVLKKLKEESARVVLLNHPPTRGLTTLNSDDAAGVQQVTELFAKHGHQRIAWLSPARWFDASTQRRAEALKQSCQSLGLDYHRITFPIETGLDSAMDKSVMAEHAQTSLSAFLHKGEAFTALLCYNSACAAGAYKALTHAGFRIPAQVSVAAFDWHQSLYFNPELTALDSQWEELGRLAAKHLVASIDNPSAKPKQRIIEVTPVLMAGQSTGTVSTAHSAARAAGER